MCVHAYMCMPVYVCVGLRMSVCTQVFMCVCIHVWVFRRFGGLFPIAVFLYPSTVLPLFSLPLHPGGVSVEINRMNFTEDSVVVTSLNCALKLDLNF